MSLSLPSPFALYVNLENAGDTDTLSACFAPNAIVSDEGQTYEGLAEALSQNTQNRKV